MEAESSDQDVEEVIEIEAIEESSEKECDSLSDARIREPDREREGQRGHYARGGRDTPIAALACDVPRIPETDLNTILTQLDHENTDLRSQIRTQRQENAELSALVQHLEEETREMRTCIRLLENEKRLWDADAAERWTRAEEKAIAEHRRQSEQYQEDLQRLQVKNRRLRDRNKRRKREIEDSRRMLRETREQHSRLEDEHDRLKMMKDELENLYNQKEQRISGLLSSFDSILGTPSIDKKTA